MSAAFPGSAPGDQFGEAEQPVHVGVLGLVPVFLLALERERFAKPQCSTWLRLESQ